MGVKNLNIRYLTIFILLWMCLARHCLANDDDNDSSEKDNSEKDNSKKDNFSVSQIRNDFSISQISHSREEPLKLEVKSSDLIRPNVKTLGSTGIAGSTGSTGTTTLARSTTTPWSTSDTTTLIRRHSTAEPIIKVRNIKKTIGQNTQDLFKQ